MKIKKMYLPKYAMELSTITLENDASIKILDYIKQKSMPIELQNAILNNNYRLIIQLIRKYTKQENHKKHVCISYSCNVFSTISKTTHFIKDTLASGFYNNLQEIKKIVDYKKAKNNNENITNLKFDYKFCFK